MLLFLKPWKSLPSGALFFCLCLTLFTTGCNNAQETEQTTEDQPPTQMETEATPPADPPTPPIVESFDDKPQLSLFPRVAGARPENEDSEGLSYWKTFIEHLQKTAGIARGGGQDGSNCWMFRGNSGLPSLGYFSPLAVQPETSYRISFDFRGEMPEKGEAGAGILEFREFLWISDQFTESELQDNLLRSQKGVSVLGTQPWGTHTFDFTTTPQTGMIHLILFREGEQAREPVFFDNLRIEEIPSISTQVLEKAQ